MDNLLQRIEMVLGMMLYVGPRSLRAYLGKPGPDVNQASPAEVDGMVDLLLSEDPNNPARLRFSTLLRSWDNAKDVTWADGTTRNTAERRRLIHKNFASNPELESRIDSAIPYYPLDEPVIISEAHKEWYKPAPGVRDYYWSSYAGYLRGVRKWDEAAVLNLDNATRSIVECLADPLSSEAYASRGLVMGYVQSGKTANFIGVAARAADAGYRLIIILAGTWNILRNQTQRRFDKELLGKELLENDESYQNHPSDWPDFLEHGGNPAERGHFVWQRLTRPDIDFRRLKAAIDNLEFEKVEKSASLNAQANLHSMPAKLLVIKKHSGILKNLVKDLKLLRTKLTDLPTLIIDDESDQAGLNTIDPARMRAGGQKRAPTNAGIVDLLGLFPRGQYIGYTATPYANALVDPDDPADLFPRDFIVSLDRPSGYMGVSDFFDPESSYDDLDRADYSLPEIAFIRRVTNTAGSDDDDLRLALRSFVMAGAVKLYRNTSNPERYRQRDIQHHTMLIHTSHLKGEHASLAARIEALWDECAFNSPKGQTALEQLWSQDHAKVSKAVDHELMPSSFADLVPHLAEAIKRIQKGGKSYLVLNGDSVDAPDFGAQSVWKIVIGGNKLSRGYTIEGLTVSYYRRVAGTGDTLMQMGRWFGFRPGYKDLVRVYLGVREGRRADIDLVSLFKEVCRMEEHFRADVSRYVRSPGAKPLTPKQIPPLIALFGNLPPTASNKMFNAMVEKRNFGGRRTMPTLVAAEKQGQDANLAALQKLLESTKLLGSKVLGGQLKSGNTKSEDMVVFCAQGSVSLIAFLTEFRWLEKDYSLGQRPADIGLQIEFLQKANHGIASWLFIAPQRKISFGNPLEVAGMRSMSVKNRKRTPGRGFEVFGEPGHRVIADYLAGIDHSQLVSPNAETSGLAELHCGVVLLYPVRETEGGSVNVGFEIFFPPNGLPFETSLTVRRKADMNSVVVS